MIRLWRLWRLRVWDRRVFKLEVILGTFIEYPYETRSQGIRDRADDLRNKVKKAKYRRAIYSELVSVPAPSTPVPSIPKASVKREA